MFRTIFSARRSRPRKHARRALLNVEILETRCLLSATNVLQPLAFPVDPPNDTYYSLQWDMAGAYGSNAQAAWQAGYTGLNAAPVYVGVVDEGIQYTHIDLVGRVRNPGEVVGNRKDDDKNGKVDDAYGWDFYSNNNSVYDGVQDDHGTHVAGTIGANGNNGIGVAGVDWNVGMISAKFLGPNGGSTSGAVAAINYLVDLKVNHGVNIVAVNASWGGGGYSQSLYNAIKKAGDANILFVAAAGNNGTNTDVSPFYPADYNLDNVITVAAIDVNGGLASWSNYGATSVDIGAPGVSIASTVPSNKYAYYSGTSMAAPHVTGAIALYAAYHPDATASEIKGALLSSAAPTASLAGKTVSGGRLDIYKFITTAPTVAATTTLKTNAKTSSTIDLQRRIGNANPTSQLVGFILLPVERNVRSETLQIPLSAAALAPQGPLFVQPPTTQTNQSSLVSHSSSGQSQGQGDLFDIGILPGKVSLLSPSSTTSSGRVATSGVTSSRWLPALDAVFEQQAKAKKDEASAQANSTGASTEENVLVGALAMAVAGFVFGTNGDQPRNGPRYRHRIIR